MASPGLPRNFWDAEHRTSNIERPTSNGLTDVRWSMLDIRLHVCIDHHCESDKLKLGLQQPTLHCWLCTAQLD
jgi:hypothetical protein